jgi:hypothetical protein
VVKLIGGEDCGRVGSESARRRRAERCGVSVASGCGPISRWPWVRDNSNALGDLTENAYHPPERSAATVSDGHIEAGCERGLVCGLVVAPISGRPFPYLFGGAAPNFGVGCRACLRQDPSHAAKRLDRCEKPRLVLTSRHDHEAWDRSRLGRGPGLDLRCQVLGAVVVAVEDDEDCRALRSHPSQAHRLTNTFLAGQIGTWPLDRSVDAESVGLGCDGEPPQQLWDCTHLPSPSTMGWIFMRPLPGTAPPCMPFPAYGACRRGRWTEAVRQPS